MTRVHQVLRCKRVVPVDRDRSRLSGGARGSGLFCQPTDHCTARNTEGAFQSSQTTAFLISAKDFFLAFWSIGRTARILATLPSARTTTVLLLSVRGNTIFGEVRTAAMPAGDKHGNHSVKPFAWRNHRQYTMQFDILPLPYFESNWRSRSYVASRA